MIPTYVGMTPSPRPYPFKGEGLTHLHGVDLKYPAAALHYFTTLHHYRHLERSEESSFYNQRQLLDSSLRSE